MSTNDIELKRSKQLSGDLKHGLNYEGDFYASLGSSFVRMTPAGSIVWTSDHLTMDYHDTDSVAFSPSTVFWGHLTTKEEQHGTKVLALNRRTGDRKWLFETAADGLHNQISAIASFSPDLMVVGSDGTGSGDDQEPLLYGLNPSNGNQIWKTGNFRPGFFSTIFSYDDALYVVMGERIYRCSPSTGSTKELNHPSFDSLGLLFGPGSFNIGSYLYLCGSSLVSFNLNSQQVRWKTPVTEAVNGKPVVDNERIFVGSDAGFVYGLDIKSGEKQWRNRVFSEVTNMATTSRFVWVRDKSGSLFGFSQQSGKKVFEKKTDMDPLTQPISAIGRTLLIGEYDGGSQILKISDEN